MPIGHTRGWLVALFAFNLVYLIVEFAFNAELVDLAGGRHLDFDRLERLEVIGRTVAGVGFALLVLGLLRPHWVRRLGMLPMLAIAFAVCVPPIYLAQRALVDYLIDHHFDAEARQFAQYTTLLKTGIGTDTLRIEGVAFDPELRDSPEQKTFLALIGAVVFQANSLMQALHEQRHEIAKRYVHNAVIADEPVYWAAYERGFVQVRDSWQRYQQVSADYVGERNQTSACVDAIWREVDQQVGRGWADYQRGRDRFLGEIDSAAMEASERLHRYFVERARCSNDRCRTRYDEAYEREVQQIAGQYVPPQYWLSERDYSWVERNCHSTRDSTECNPGFAELLDPRRWFSREPRPVWDRSVPVIRDKLVLLQLELENPCR